LEEIVEAAEAAEAVEAVEVVATAHIEKKDFITAGKSAAFAQTAASR